MKLTHKGWFGICPVYIGGIESDGPLLVERSPLLLPLMMLSEAIFKVLITIKSVSDPEWEPMWPIYVTGDIDPRDPPDGDIY